MASSEHSFPASLSADSPTGHASWQRAKTETSSRRFGASGSSLAAGHLSAPLYGKSPQESLKKRGEVYKICSRDSKESLKIWTSLPMSLALPFEGLSEV